MLIVTLINNIIYQLQKITSFLSLLLLPPFSVSSLYQCSTPFELYDDNYILKAMKFCERREGNDLAHNFPVDRGESSSIPSTFQPQITSPSKLSIQLSRTPTSPPLPGIIKARVKRENH